MNRQWAARYLSAVWSAERAILACAAAIRTLESARCMEMLPERPPAGEKPRPARKPLADRSAACCTAGALCSVMGFLLGWLLLGGLVKSSHGKLVMLILTTCVGAALGVAAVLLYERGHRLSFRVETQTPKEIYERARGMAEMAQGVLNNAIHDLKDMQDDLRAGLESYYDEPPFPMDCRGIVAANRLRELLSAGEADTLEEACELYRQEVSGGKSFSDPIADDLSAHMRSELACALSELRRQLNRAVDLEEPRPDACLRAAHGQIKRMQGAIAVFKRQCTAKIPSGVHNVAQI